MESYLSDVGSKMESVYDIFSTVRLELSESREALSVRLRASEIMNRTLELSIIMDDLVDLIRKEFKLDLAVIRLIDEREHSRYPQLQRDGDTLHYRQGPSTPRSTPMSAMPSWATRPDFSTTPT